MSDKIRELPTDLATADFIGIPMRLAGRKVRTVLKGRITEYRVADRVLFSAQEVNRALAELAAETASSVRSRP